MTSGTGDIERAFTAGTPTVGHPHLLQRPVRVRPLVAVPDTVRFALGELTWTPGNGLWCVSRPTASRFSSHGTAALGP